MRLPLRSSVFIGGIGACGDEIDAHSCKSFTPWLVVRGSTMTRGRALALAQVEDPDCGGVKQGSNPQTWPVPQPSGDVMAQAQVWKLRDAKGRLALLTVPPILGRRPREFLLPAGTLVP